MPDSPVEETEENVAICAENCGECPSYPGAEEELLYCARGASEAAIERDGCKCPECPVWLKYRLGRQYYCDTGP